MSTDSPKQNAVTEPGENLSVRPGDELHLQSASSDSTERWSLRVIGFLPGKSLLVTAPTVNGTVIFVKTGETFLVRIFSGKRVIAFRTSVLQCPMIPFPYLHLAWPREIRAIDVRKNSRAVTNIVAVASKSEHDGVGGRPCRIVDISGGGAKITAKAPLGIKGDVVWVSFRVKLDDGFDEYVKVQALVCSVEQGLIENAVVGFTHGVQFGNLAQLAKMAIYAVHGMALGAGG